MRLFGKTNVKCRVLTAAVLILSLAFLPAASGAPVVVPDRDVQRVMGDLYALSLAMRLYYDDAGRENAGSKAENPCPAPGQLARYFKAPLPAAWGEDYRTAQVGGEWWAGRKVPEFSRARKFLRENARSLELYDKESMAAWLGGSYVWVAAVSFSERNKNGKSEPGEGALKIRAAKGEDGERLFFGSPGADYYWWSDLLYTKEAYAAALKKFGVPGAGPFAVPEAPGEGGETLSASPVSPPPDFSLERDEESTPLSVGGLIFNPIPRGHD